MIKLQYGLPTDKEGLLRSGGGTPEQCRDAVAEMAQRWGKVVREAGVKTN